MKNKDRTKKSVVKKILTRIFDISFRAIMIIASLCFIITPFLNHLIDRILALSCFCFSAALIIVAEIVKPTYLNKMEKKFAVVLMGAVYCFFIGLFVCNYFDTWFNGYWLVFFLILFGIFFTAWFLLDQNKDKHNDVYTEYKTYILKCVTFYLALNGFYISFVFDLLCLKFVFGGIALLIDFVNLWQIIINMYSKKTRRDISRIQTWNQLVDFLIGIGITAYLIYIVPNEKIQSIVLTLTATIYGGLLTLVGVAWTIKHSDRQLKNQEIQKYMPRFVVDNCFLSQIEEEEIKKLESSNEKNLVELFEKDGTLLPFAIEIELRNVNKEPYAIKKIDMDGKEYCPLFSKERWLESYEIKVLMHEKSISNKGNLTLYSVSKIGETHKYIVEFENMRITDIIYD